MRTTIDYEDESKTKVDIETVNDRWTKMFKKYAKKYPEDIQLIGQTGSSVTYSVPTEWVHLVLIPCKLEL